MRLRVVGRGGKSAAAAAAAAHVYVACNSVSRFISAIKCEIKTNMTD